jgi:hypothetical protein
MNRSAALERDLLLPLLNTDAVSVCLKHQRNRSKLWVHGTAIDPASFAHTRLLRLALGEALPQIALLVLAAKESCSAELAACRYFSRAAPNASPQALGCWAM